MFIWKGDCADRPAIVGRADHSQVDPGGEEPNAFHRSAHTRQSAPRRAHQALRRLAPRQHHRGHATRHIRAIRIGKCFSFPPAKKSKQNS